MINKGEFEAPVLIFVQSKERANELLGEMRKAFINTHIKIDCIHAVSVYFNPQFINVIKLLY